MKKTPFKILFALSVVLTIIVSTSKAQAWTFPNPTTGVPCWGCVPSGWTMTGSPDISSLDDWISYTHYSSVGVASPVPEPTPGVTSFMSAMAWGPFVETASTTFSLVSPETLTVYFGGFGTSDSGLGPVGAEPGSTLNLVVNGSSVDVPIPWDGGWTAVTYTLVAGVNTIVFDPSITDDGTKHAVSISIPAIQIEACSEDLLTSLSETTICLGDDVTLEATSTTGGIVTWDLGVINGVAFTPASASITTYTATSDSDEDCEFSVDVIVFNLPIVDAGLDQEICAGVEVTLSGSGASSYVWTDGVTDGTPFTPASTITYTVTGTDDNDCENTDDVVVTVNALPIIDAGLDFDICIGEDATLSGSGAGVGGTYAWTDGVVDGAPFTPSTTITYTVTGTDVNDCENTDDILVTINELPIINAGADQEICIGEEVIVNGSGAGIGGTYVWTGGITDGVSFGPTTTTLYTVTGTDANDCENTDDLTVTVNALPIIDAGLDYTICEGDATTLNGSGAGLGGVYIWTDAVVDGVPFTPTSTNTYTVTGTDANDCENTDDITITLDPIPNVSFMTVDQVGCVDFQVHFSNTGSTGTYKWEFGDGSESTIENPIHTYTEDGFFDVTLEVTSVAGCVSSITYPGYIEAKKIPEASFSHSILQVDVSKADVQFSNSSLYSNVYEWNFGDGTPISSAVDPVHVYSVKDVLLFDVMLVAFNDLGCSDTTYRTVEIKYPPIYYIPNVFTPDGDSYNEVFKPIFFSGYDYYDYHLQIFNRWGEMVFESYDAEYGWDGTYGNRGMVEGGVYIWRIDFGVTNSDKRFIEEGHVTLIK